MSRLPVVVLKHPVRVATYRAGAVFGPRPLTDHELIWVLSGTATRRIGDAGGGSREVDLPPGRVGLSRPGQIDVYRWAPDAITTHAYVHFDIADPGRLPPPDTWPDTVSMASAAISGLARHLLDLGADPTPAATERSHDCLALLIDMMIRGPHDGPSDPGRLRPLVELIALRWAEHGVGPVAVDDLARAMGLSRGHLTALVSERYGCGPAALVELVRLARAALLLQQGASVAVAAEECGYADPYHFSRRFRTAYGVPPSRFGDQEGAADPFAPLRRHDLLPVARLLLQAANPE